MVIMPKTFRNERVRRSLGNLVITASLGTNVKCAGIGAAILACSVIRTVAAGSALDLFAGGGRVVAIVAYELTAVWRAAGSGTGAVATTISIDCAKRCAKER